jgi:hypothetical protein
MAIKDWPKPVRRAIGWSLVVLSFEVALGPTSLLVWLMQDDLADAAFWPRLLGGYSLFLTVPITAVTVAFLTVRQQKKATVSFGVAILLGTFIGLMIGLILSIVTAGYSLLSAPTVGLCTSLVVWTIQPFAWSASSKAPDSKPAA